MNFKKNSKFIIVANGPYDHELVKNLSSVKNKNYQLIALDGAAHNLIKNDLQPDYILGDFDSIIASFNDEFAEALAYFKTLPKPNNDILKFESFKNFIRASSQNYTDLDKGVIFAKNLGATEIQILCALGGDRTDHSLHNLSVLKKNPEILIYLQTNFEIIQYLKKGDQISFNGTIGGKIGIFGFPEGKVKTKGLRWDIEDTFQLKFGEQNHACNEILAPLVFIEVIDGEILLIRPSF